MEIRTIGVIGAGALGSGIACLAALAGYATVLEDVLPEMREQGLTRIHHALDEAVARGEISREQKAEALANITTAATVEDVCRVADFLLDALPDELELKLEIFTIFDKFAKPDAILASATSTISIADLADMTYRPENCIGMRFIDPVRQMKQLEVVRASATSDATVQAAIEFGRRIGKGVVVRADSSTAVPNDSSAHGGRP